MWGDGVLAYFGYPKADEHDAEHAVRSGLALVEAVPKRATKAGSPLQVRVGIGTGGSWWSANSSDRARRRSRRWSGKRPT